MALELQLSTDKAQAGLDRIERGLDSLRLSLDKVAAGTAGFDAFLARMANVKSVNPSAVESIRELGKAAASLSGAGNLTNLNNALSKLAALDVTKAAIGVRSLVASLNTVRVPPNLGQLATELDRIANASQRAAAGMRAFGNTTGNIRVPTSAVQGLNNALQQTATQSRQASTSLAYFGSTASNVRAALTAIGIASIGREFGQFIQGAYEARVTYEKFNAIMNNTTGPETAGTQFQFLRRVAKETATDINTLTQTYPRFAMSAKAGGATAQEIGTMFQQSATFIRGFGLSNEDASGAMLALTQMMTKGKIQGEELTQQLAERGVPALTALARGMNKTEAEITKMMEAGKLGRKELALMIGELSKMSAGAVAAQLNTIQAAMTQLSNAFTYAKLAFGDSFFASVAGGLNILAAALSSNPAIAFFQTIGVAAGVAGNIILVAISGVINILTAAVGVFYTAATAVNAFYVLLSQTTIGQFASYIYQATSAMFSFQGAMQMIGSALGAMLVVGAAYLAWLMAVRVAQLAWLVVTNPIYAALAGVAVGALLVSENFNQLTETFYEGAAGAQEAVSKFGEMSGSAEDLSSKLQYTGDAALTAGDGIDNAGSAASSTAEKVKQMSAANIEAANIFDELASSAMGAAAAIDMASNAGNRGGGGGGGGGSNWGGKWKFGDYAGGRPIDDSFWDWGFMDSLFSRSGGYSDRTSVSQVRKPVHASAFAGAPHFAGGGTTRGMRSSLPDGGIPAVLHKNEAVVPLDSGGKIPVSQQGGSDGAALVNAMSREFGKSGALLQEINKHLATIKEGLNALGVVYKTEMDRHLTELQHHQRLMGELGKAMGRIEVAIMNALSRMSPGGGAPIPTGPGLGGPDDGWMPDDDSVHIGYTGRRGKGGGGPGGAGLRPGTSGRKGGRMGAYEMDDSPFPGFSGRGFATGSPNAYADVMRGSAAQVAIHPDEAIIPLPDGRRVPVDLGDADPPHRARQYEMSGEDTRRSREDARPDAGGRVTVNMYVTTPDAKSFRNSEDQITQRLAQRLERATRTLGAPSDVDDPTRPPALNRG